LGVLNILAKAGHYHRLFHITPYNFGPIKIIGGILMTENKNEGLLKTVLVIYIVVVLVYGILYFLVPDFLVKLSGGTPVFNVWLRW
jgi:small neutral amino acid transporter SnatA (MarC family)